LPGDPRPVDQEAIRRLFDEDRDPGELVTAGDWHPSRGGESWEAWAELDGHAGHTVADRRRWYRTLEALGEL
jgi:hypothetical protein